MSRTELLSDDAWALIEPLMPAPSGKGGRPFAEHRTIVEAIIWRYRTEPHWVWWRLWSFGFNQGLGALLGSVEPPFELGGREVVEVAV